VHDRTSVLDPERLAILSELDDGEGDLLAALTGEFEQDAHVQLDELRAAVGRNDAAGVLQAAHRLKGASANLGALQLADVCARLEQLGRSEQLETETAGDLVDEVSAELGRAAAALHALSTRA
jgi:two-component system, sensor histidine kinase and response regulator